MLSDRCPVCLSVLSVTLVYCGQMVGWIKMKLGVQVGLGPGHIVLRGYAASPPPKEQQPPTQFSAHICCGQMAGWIKMPLGLEVGLGPGDFVLDGDPALPSVKREQSPLPIFGPSLLWSNGWIDQDGTWHARGPRPRPHCARRAPSSPSKKGHRPPILAHVCCGQTAGWIKMPLGTKVGPGHIVLDGDCVR